MTAPTKRLQGLLVFLGISLISLCGCTSASEMKAFGLVGSWSSDCAKTRRVTFEAPLIGSPKITYTDRDDPERAAVYVIQDAVRLTEDKIRIVSLAKQMPTLPGKYARIYPQQGELWESVYEKVSSNKIRPLVFRQKDGPKIQYMDGMQYRYSVEPDGTVKALDANIPMLIQEKCLS